MTVVAAMQTIRRDDSFMRIVEPQVADFLVERVVGLDRFVWRVWSGIRNGHPAASRLVGSPGHQAHKLVLKDLGKQVRRHLEVLENLKKPRKRDPSGPSLFLEFSHPKKEAVFYPSGIKTHVFRQNFAKIMKSRKSLPNSTYHMKI